MAAPPPTNKKNPIESENKSTKSVRFNETPPQPPHQQQNEDKDEPQDDQQEEEENGDDFEQELERPSREIKDCKYCDLCRPNWRPKMAVNVPPNINYVDHLSRQDLIHWFNDCLEDQLWGIEDLGRGTVYCCLMEMLFPRSVAFVKIKFGGKLTRDYIHNFRLLQTAFKKMGVNKVIPVLKLVQCRLQDNWEFALWFKKFFDANDKGMKFCQLNRKNAGHHCQLPPQSAI